MSKFNMVKPVMAGMGIGTAGTLGTQGYVKKKKQERAVRDTIYNLLPQELPDQERFDLANQIMKGASDSYGIDKLAYAEAIGELLYGEDVGIIMKQAEEDFKYTVSDLLY